MWQLFEFIYKEVQEACGSPVSLRRFLDTRPQLATTLTEPARSIAQESVVMWHELGDVPFDYWRDRKRGEVLGWHHECGTYSSFYLQREEFANFGSCEITEDWECDIQDITGLANSKSELKDFDSLDHMVETKSRDMIEPISTDKLRENLAWSEIRIMRGDGSSDSFARYLWDGRLFLINSGGSHHFAAARYIASRTGARVPLRGRLRTYSINEKAVASLQRDFEMFVITNTLDAHCGFHDVMKDFRASYLWHFLPRPYCDCDAILLLLPRSDARSMKVATLLRESDFFDFGLYMDSLVKRCMQNAHSA